MVTLLHEHFHQLQMSQPNYQSEVTALGLAGGDETGMWMLNFPFPYDSIEVKKRFSVLVATLSDALQAIKRKEFSEKLSLYLEARRHFVSTLNPDAYKYFSFQLWQEGIARYTEYRIARLAAAEYKPSREFASLPDFRTFGEVANSLLENIFSELNNLDIGKHRRVVFYSVGAAEGLLLDSANAHWQKKYFAEKFYMERCFSQ